MARKKLVQRLKVKRLLIVVLVPAILGVLVHFLHDFQVRRHAGTLMKRADAAVGQQDWAAASKLYQNFLNFEPNNVDARVKYAGVLEEIKKTKPATIHELVNVYERILRLDETRAEERRKLAKYCVELGQYNNARAHLKVLIGGEAKTEKDAELHDLMGLCDERETKFPEAVAHYQRAVATGYATPETYTRLALILHNKIQSVAAQQQAVEVINKLVSSKSNDISARIARAQFWTRIGELPRAREDVEHAYRNMPGGRESPEVALALAELASNEAELKIAREALEQNAKAHPEDARLPLRLANLQVQMNNPTGAKTTLQTAAKRFTKPDNALLEIADRLLELGDPATASSVAERFSAASEVKFISDYLTARAKLLEGNWPAALPLFRTSIVNGLNRYPAQYLKALLGQSECYRLADNPDQRLKSCEAAVALDGASITAALGRAEALAQLGKIREAIEAYRGLVRTAPPARVALARLLMQEQLAKPERERVWAGIDEVLGMQPYTVEVALIKADELFLQRKPADAMALLEETVKRYPDQMAPRVALARSQSSMASGLDIIDKAEREIRDHVDLRLARAILLMRQNPVDTALIKALGDNIGAFARVDRFRLLYELGEVLAMMGKPNDAVELLTRAAAEMPYDLNSRALLFSLALDTKNEALQAKTLKELAAIEGPDGPVTMVSEVIRSIRQFQPGTTPATAELRAKLATVLTKRESWGRVYALLGDLDLMDNKPDAALEHFRKAAELGPLTEPLVRVLVAMLLDRQGQTEAVAVLDRYSRMAPLAPDLQSRLIALRAAFGDDQQGTLAWARSPAADNSPRAGDHLIRAAIFITANAPAEARSALDKAAARDPNSPEVWVALVQFLASTGKMTEAQSIATEAETKLARNPDRVAALIALGKCQEVLGQDKKATDLYQQALKIAPTNQNVLQQLYLLDTKLGNRKEAETLLNSVLGRTDAPLSLKLWARRNLAFTRVSQPDNIPEVPGALELIEQNIREGGNLIEDQRARALIQAIDPVRQPEAITNLIDSAKQYPLSPEQNYMLARMHIQQGRWDQAELALREATRAATLANPVHLALLTQVQVTRQNPGGARATVARLKTIAPGSWERATAESRVIAAEGNKAEAARFAIDAANRNTSGGNFRVSALAPFLEEIGAIDEARAEYLRWAGESKQPNAHLPLGQFYLRHGQANEAIALAFERKDQAPPATTARILAGAVRSRPKSTIPPAEQAAWDKTLKQIDEWLRSAQVQQPKNPDLLFARAELDDVYGRYDEQISTYDQALAIEPNNAVFLNNLATIRALAKQDGSDATVSLVEKAIARKGRRPTLLDTLALVNMAGKRYDSAIADLREAIRAEPKAIYYYHLAVALNRLSDERPGLTEERNQAFQEATRRGLKESMLHPLEVEEYRKLKSTLMPGT